MDPKWSTHHLVYTLIKELNSTEDQIYKMNYIGVLNWLSYFHSVNKIKEANNK